MSTESMTTPGYYGKVPTHGDFVSRGLPQSFITPWDNWLQEAIMTSQQQLGHQWLNYYLTSPLYRFILSPGICGEKGWLGVLMPSVDKVGRYYPMTISLMNNAGLNPFTALQKKNAWFIDLEKLALTCLKDGFNLDDFNSGISQLTLEENTATAAADARTPFEQMRVPASLPAWHQSLSSPDLIPDLLPTIVDKEFKEQYFAYSLWWTEGSELVSPSLLVCAGLPPFNGVAAMFDGNWQRWGWAGNRYSAISSK